MAQLGTKKIETPTGPVSLPIFEVADAGSSVYTMYRQETAGGTGFVPMVDPADAAFPYFRVQTQNHGVLAAHNEASLVFTSVTSTLSGDTAKLTLYEDTSGDGSADYQETYSLSGGTEPLDISSFPQGASSTWWWSVEFTDDGDISDAGQIEKVEVNY